MDTEWKQLEADEAEHEKQASVLKERRVVLDRIAECMRDADTLGEEGARFAVGLLELCIGLTQDMHWKLRVIIGRKLFFALYGTGRTDINRPLQETLVYGLRGFLQSLCRSKFNSGAYAVVEMYRVSHPHLLADFVPWEQRVVDAMQAEYVVRSAGNIRDS